ncbi:hypothetical protein ACLB2K_038751 [Fragaria x ananassa]
MSGRRGNRNHPASSKKAVPVWVPKATIVQNATPWSEFIVVQTQTSSFSVPGRFLVPKFHRTYYVYDDDIEGTAGGTLIHFPSREEALEAARALKPLPPKFLQPVKMVDPIPSEDTSARYLLFPEFLVTWTEWIEEILKPERAADVGEMALSVFGQLYKTVRDRFEKRDSFPVLRDAFGITKDNRVVFVAAPTGNVLFRNPIVDNRDVRAAVDVHDDGLMIMEADILNWDKKLSVSFYGECVYLQLPLLVKQPTLAASVTESLAYHINHQMEDKNVVHALLYEDIFNIEFFKKPEDMTLEVSIESLRGEDLHDDIMELSTLASELADMLKQIVKAGVQSSTIDSAIVLLEAYYSFIQHMYQTWMQKPNLVVLHGQRQLQWFALNHPVYYDDVDTLRLFNNLGRLADKYEQGTTNLSNNSNFNKQIKAKGLHKWRENLDVAIDGNFKKILEFSFRKVKRAQQQVPGALQQVPGAQQQVPGNNWKYEVHELPLYVSNSMKHYWQHAGAGNKLTKLEVISSLSVILSGLINSLYEAYAVAVVDGAYVHVNKKVEEIVTQFKAQGINTKLNLDENKRMRDTHSIVPISAKSDEGIPDLLSLMVYWSQKSMAEKVTYINEVRYTLLEVNYVEGLGTTIDVILVNGVLHRGDQIVVCTDHGTPIVTRIQSLLTPEPMKELCVKGKYQHHSEIRAAQAIKITSPQGFKHAIAGTALYVVGPDIDLEEIKEASMEDMMNCVLVNDHMSGSNSSSGDKGVCAQASAQGSLEAMLEFLKGLKKLIFRFVKKANVMLEKKILAFEVKVTPEAQKLSDKLGVKIFVGDIMHEVIEAYMKNLKDEKEKELAAVEEEAVFRLFFVALMLLV